MAPPKRPWFRLYVELIWDRKIRRLPEKARWLFVVVLACSRQSPLPGWLMLDDRAPMDWDDLCDAANMKRKDVEKGMGALQEVGIIEWDPNIGAWCIPKWNDRQFESDETTKRSQKHRRRNVASRPDETPQKTEAEEPEAEAESEPLKVGEGSTPGNPNRAREAGDLVARMVSVCEIPDTQAAFKVVTHLSSYLADTVIDECIGYCAGLSRDRRPRHPNYFEATLRSWAEERNISIPAMNGATP